MSYMVLPERLLCIYEKEYRFINSTVSKIDQMIVERFLADGHYERHLNRMRALYKSRHDTLLNALKPLLHIGSVSGEYAGVHLLFTFHDGRSEQDAVKKAGEYGIRIYGLSAFETRKSQRSCTILLGFANLPEEEIREGAALLTEKLLEHKGEALLELLLSIWENERNRRFSKKANDKKRMKRGNRMKIKEENEKSFSHHVCRTACISASDFQVVLLLEDILQVS